jgi:hypothetical protein
LQILQSLLGNPEGIAGLEEVEEELGEGLLIVISALKAGAAF